MKAFSNTDSQIKNYLPLLNEDQKEALLLVAKTFAEKSQVDDVGYNGVFLAELEERTRSMEDGSVLGIPWEKVKEHARQAVKAKDK